MKKVVSLVLVVLVATLMSAQVFASSPSPSSSGSPSLITGPEDMVITPYANKDNAPVDVIKTDLEAAKKELAAASDPKSLVSSLTGDNLTYGDLFDASIVQNGDIVASGAVEFTVSTDLKAGDTVQVIHRLGANNWEKVDAEVTDKGLVIKASSLSPFAVVRTSSSNNGGSPQTGNQVLVMYGIGAVAFATAAVVLLRKKENA